MNVKTFATHLIGFLFRSDSYLIKKLLLEPRYRPGIVKLRDLSIIYADGPSTYHQYRSIFINECYAFKNATSAKYIIDCGANIGLSVIFLRQHAPNAEIVAFESNPSIFELLKKNVSGLENINLRQTAVWNSNGSVKMNLDEADGSSITHTQKKSHITTVACERLSNYLTKEVDFLKLDIEGAEVEVLKEIESKLSLVKNLFIEYHCSDLTNNDLLYILSVLSKAGYRYYLRPENVPISPFKTVHNSSNSFFYQVNIFAFK